MHNFELGLPAGYFAALEAPGVGAVVHSNYEFIINKLAVLSCLRKGYFAEWWMATKCQMTLKFSDKG